MFAKACFLFCIISYVPRTFGLDLEEKKIVIVVCSYNNNRYYKWNLDSLLTQKYSNFTIMYVNDCSNDGTYEGVQEYIKTYDIDHRIRLIHNEKREMALSNLYKAIHMCDDTDLIVIVDGDDRLHHDQVLAYINKVYQDPNVWLTYGQFVEYPLLIKGFCIAYPADIVEKKRFRYFTETPSHLRTFYAGLFKKIRKEDLMFQDEFFPICYDLAIMFPMLEMAGKNFRFIEDILLEYNGENPINDHKLAKKLQRKFDLIIRARTVYPTIQSPF